jgi:crotonobetainyl-CoA:carnitine CoA-transferase CaiB-like acyl-CoA transferase
MLYESGESVMSLALKGIKVVDASQAVAVPMAARHLGDFGADVVHVEPPLTGDSWRAFQAGAGGGGNGPPSDINYNFETFNRNKRGLSLDLSQENGQVVMYKLLEEADVFLTNMRPSEQERFRMDYGTLHERFPRLIHGSVSGVGKNGPERDLPAYDATALWFRSGMHYALSQRGIGGMGWRPAFGDTVAAMSLFAGVMTALYTRERTGLGQQVDLSLFNVGVYQLSFDMAGFLTTGTDFREMVMKMVEDEGDTPRMQLRAQLLAEAETAMARLREFFLENITTPLSTPYRTRDGRDFHINILQPDRYYPRICRAIGRDDLIDDPRFATHEPRMENGPELYRIMRDAFLTKTLDEWRPILTREEIPWAPQQTIREVVNDPQARANDFFVPFDHPTHGRMEVVANPVKLSETPSTVRLPAPEFSQHTEAVLLEAGYSWEDIARFKEKGIIA